MEISLKAEDPWGVDAKGQIAVMSSVCERLFESGETNFGLLIQWRRSWNSYGAIAANKVIKGCKYVDSRCRLGTSSSAHQRVQYSCRDCFCKEDPHYLGYP
ncbi:MAG: hypothetical protein R3A12_01950 [Ignavibacteria bacterium]